jgi:hypothetical protein
MSTLLFEGRANWYGEDGCLFSNMEAPAGLAALFPLGEITHLSGPLDNPTIIWFRSERGHVGSVDISEATDYTIVD